MIIRNIICLTLIMIKISFAISSTYDDKGKVNYSLIIGDYDQGSGKILAGLRFNIDEGYYLNYKDSPENTILQIDSRNSSNIKQLELIWPKPQSKKLFGGKLVKSIYKDEVIFPIIIEVEDPIKDVEVSLGISFVVCGEQCSKYYSQLGTNVQPGYQNNWGEKLISHILNQEPLPDKIASIEVNYISFSFVLIYSLLGGVILNFMPCVLPIISLKLMHVSSLKSGIRFNLFIVISGILSAFILMASIVILFRQSLGNMILGAQLQNIYFLIFAYLSLIFYISNLLGRFSLKFNVSGLDNLAGSGKSHHFRNFLSGFFIPFIGVSCTAPFLATAISFTLTLADAFQTLLIFLVIGLGFSSFYIVGFIFPNVPKRLLPKSGKWMEKLQQFTAFLVAATALWILYLIGAHYSVKTAIMTFLLSILIKALIEAKLNSAIKFTATSCIIMLALYAPKHFTKLENEIKSYRTGIWNELRPEHIGYLVANSKIVFVDITADWCLACKLNKFLVLDREFMRPYFRNEKIVMMQADMTSTNEVAAKFIRDYNEVGVPFNIIFGPKAPEGIILPSLLSKSRVIRAIIQAGFPQDLL